MKRILRCVTLALLGASGAAFLSGCVGKTAVPAGDTLPPGAVVLSPQEYEYVYVTGSNLPVLRPKQASVQPISQIGSSVTTMSAEQFRDLVRRGQTSR